MQDFLISFLSKVKEIAPVLAPMLLSHYQVEESFSLIEESSSLIYVKIISLMHYFKTLNSYVQPMLQWTISG